MKTRLLKTGSSHRTRWVALRVAALLALGAGQTFAATSTVTFTYTNAGPADLSTNWTCPVGVTSVQVACWGGGGGSGSAHYNGTLAFGGGGGAGGSFAGGSVAVSAGTTYPITVGAGGTAGATNVAQGTAAGTGGASWFGSVATVYAQGGAGGTNGVTAQGKGATASSALCVGSVINAGGNGAAANGNGGGGGGSAGSAAPSGTGVGGSGSGITGGTAGSPDGVAGAAGRNGFGVGNAGVAPGGGAGGAKTAATSVDNPGNNGGGGRVTLTYTTPTYYATGGDATLTNNWNTILGGGGNNPVNFTSGGLFIIPNGVSMTLSANWTNTSPETGPMTSGITVQSGGTLACAAKTITGNVPFTLESGGNLSLGAVSGITTGTTGNIQVTGTRTFSTTANYAYTFAGVGAPATGNALPASVSNFTAAGSVRLSNSGLTINGAYTVAAGATNDVSTSALTLGGTASLTATGNSSAPATINAGGSTPTVDLSSRPVTLNFAPPGTAGDATHPALNLSAGTLNLAGSTIAVNNNGSALDVGDYTLISGAVTGTPATGTVTVGGSGGLVGGTSATLDTSSGQLVMHVGSGSLTPTTLTLTRTAGSSPSIYGDSLRFHAVVSPDPGAGSPIAFFYNNVLVGTVNTTASGSNGVADLVITTLGYSGGSAYPVSASFAGNVNFANSSGTLAGGQQVNQKTLTLSGFTAQNKLYDATTNATVSGTVAGVTNSDVLVVSGSFADANPGTGKAVTVFFTGAAAGNYTFAQPAGLTAAILNPVAWNNPAGGNWNTAGNWQSNLVANGNLITADFSTLDLTADATVHLDSTNTINGIIFGDTATGSAAGWLLDDNGSAGANTLTLAGTTPTVTVNSLGGSKEATISAGLVGTAGLTKNGNGTLTLSGTNNYAGITTVNAGTLKNGSATTFSGKNILQLNNTAVFDLDGHDATFSRIVAPTPGTVITNSAAGTGTNFLTVTNQLSGIGALVMDGATAKTGVVLKNNNSTFSSFGVTNLNTFSGGLLLADASAGAGVGTQLRIAALITGTPFGSGPITIGQAPTDKASVSLGGVAGIVLNNNLVFNTALGTDQPGFRVESASNILSGAVTANLAPALFAAGATLSGAVSLTGQVTGPAGLSVANGGSGTVTVTLSNATANANNYAGVTLINSTKDFLVLAAAHQIPNGAGKGDVTDNGTLKLAGGNETINGLNGTGLVDCVSGTSTLTVGDNNASGAFSGVFTNSAGSLGLTKIGSGTQTFSGVNTYSGNTTVSGGTLELAQTTLATNSTVVVAGGAVLKLSVAATNRVAGLVLNGINQPGGLYNSVSAAPFLTGAGSLQVVTSVNLTPCLMTNRVIGGTNLVLTWPADHTGWRLQVQTNPLSVGLVSNPASWVTIPNTELNSSYTNSINPANGTVFYRMVYP